MDNFKKLIFLVFPAILIISYQNCSDVEFSSQQPQLEGSANNNGATNEDNLPSGELREVHNDDNNINVEVNFECNNYQELTQGNVPVRDESGTCYYIKLMNNQNSHRSGSWEEERASEVLADNHDDGPSPNPPFILGEQYIELNFASSWNMSLSGQYDDPNATMYIDNFFLVEAYTDEQRILLARGTADAEPHSGRITVGETEVTNFISYAPNGTAEVTAIPIFTETPKNTLVDFRFRALDCGGSARASDVYLVFH